MRRVEHLYDIVHQERLCDDLDIDVDDNPIPITFNLTLILLVHHITKKYSPIIQDWLERHPICIVDRQNPSEIDPPFESECICIRWTGSGADIWSSRRIFDAEDTPQVTGSKTRRPQHWTQTNTIAKYFQQIQVGPPRKRQGQAQNKTSTKVKRRKINTSPTEETDISDQKYEHQKKGRVHRENDRIP